MPADTRRGETMANDTIDSHRSSEWGEERLRYSILETVYHRAGGSCEQVVTGAEIGATLGLRYEDLFRVIHFLEHHGYLTYLGSGPRVCITDKGLRYIEEFAARRRSVRTDGPLRFVRTG
jgi:hypothetical protein